MAAAGGGVDVIRLSPSGLTEGTPGFRGSPVQFDYSAQAFGLTKEFEEVQVNLLETLNKIYDLKKSGKIPAKEVQSSLESLIAQWMKLWPFLNIEALKNWSIYQTAIDLEITKIDLDPSSSESLALNDINIENPTTKKEVIESIVKRLNKNKQILLEAKLQKIQVLRMKIADLMLSIDENTIRVKKLKSKIEENLGRRQEIQGKMKLIQQNLDELKGKDEKTQKERAQTLTDEFNQLSRTLANLETEVNNLQILINKLNKCISENEIEMESLVLKINTVAFDDVQLDPIESTLLQKLDEDQVNKVIKLGNSGRILTKPDIELRKIQIEACLKKVKEESANASRKIQVIIPLLETKNKELSKLYQALSNHYADQIEKCIAAIVFLEEALENLNKRLSELEDSKEVEPLPTFLRKSHSSTALDIRAAREAAFLKKSQSSSGLDSKAAPRQTSFRPIKTLSMECVREVDEPQEEAEDQTEAASSAATAHPSSEPSQSIKEEDEHDIGDRAIADIDTDRALAAEELGALKVLSEASEDDVGKGKARA
ncbi:MAG: hypothetical protein HZB76_00925 [Chlamydiae bacterium]|nr:hypothetical protein [Chlamydiota bacterium]